MPPSAHCEGMEPTPRKDVRHERRPLFASSLAYAGAALALTFGIAACVPAPDSTPAPTPSPTPVTRAPAPAPAPAPTYDNWMDAPRTPGDWSYSTEQVANARYSSAEYAGTSGEMLARITCSPTGNVLVQRYTEPRGVYNRTMTIRTETVTRSLRAPVDPEGQNMFAAVVPARDPLLDAMALTKGRFALELANAPTLYLPAWAEVTRVIEDCR